MPVNNVKGAIMARYKSESELAKRLGWDRQKLNRITNGIMEPRLGEVAEIADALSMPVHELAQFFLELWSQKCDGKEAAEYAEGEGRGD